MLAALKAVESGMGINKAACEHGVPATTLKDWVSGRVAHAPDLTYVSVEEETELGTFLKNCACVGYGKTRKDVLLIAESVAKEKNALLVGGGISFLNVKKIGLLDKAIVQPTFAWTLSIEKL